MLTWQYLFEDGDQKRVVDVLMTYQNADGGFGMRLSRITGIRSLRRIQHNYAISENWWKAVTAIEMILLLRNLTG